MMLDVHVFHRDMLDSSDACLFSRPWLVQYPNGFIVQFDTENDACTMQRAHRECIGVDPIMGIEIADLRGWKHC